MFPSIIETLRRARLRRRQMAELSRLSDAALNDIGLTRFDLHQGSGVALWSAPRGKFPR